MATVLGLALKITADASAVPKALNPVERAFKALDAEAAKVSDAFKRFGADSAKASESQAKFATDLAFLQSALRTGKVDAQEFAAQFAAIQKEASDTATAIEEGIGVTKANRTEEEKRAASLSRLTELLSQGAIDQQTYTRAAAEYNGEAERVAAAEKQRAAESQRVAEIIEANLTREERAQRNFAAATSELAQFRERGLLTEEQYARALDRVAGDYAKATLAADKFAASSAKAGDGGTLKFNELSGILSALPGPIGNVAGRLSGLASAGEGLSRVFAGGLSKGLSGIGSTLAGLANPLTLAVGGIAAFGTAAYAIGRGLAELESQVEMLGNTALRLGTDFQTIQVLDEAARRSGGSIDALASGIQKLSVKIDEARKGSGDAAKAFQELGISQEELRKSDPTTIAQRLGAALQNVADPARRAALATDTLGKSGLSLLPAFNAIGEAEVSLQRFSATINDIDRDRIASLGSAFDNVQTSLSGLGRAVLLPFAGLTEGVANVFANLTGTVTRVVKGIGIILTPLLDAIGAGLNKLADGIAYVNSFLDGWIGTASDAAKVAVEFQGDTEAAAKSAEELAKAIESSSKALDNVIAKASEFGQAGFNAAYQFQQALVDLNEQAKEDGLNAEQYARGVANATAEYERQIESIKKVQEETKKLADAAAKKADEDKKRLDQLLSPENDATLKVQKDIAFVIEQQTAAQLKLAEARSAGNRQEADATAARLAQLDGLRTKLETQEQAISQGFANGFSEAFKKTDESVAALANETEKFGRAGDDAIASLQRGVDALQQQVEQGILTQGAYDAEVARQKKLFDERIAQLETIKQREDEARKATFDAQIAAADRVQSFLDARLNDRQRAEAEGDAAAADRKIKAAQNVSAIEQRLALEKQALEAAREQNDARASRAAVERVKTLEAALLVEQRIADGRVSGVHDQQQLIASQQEFQQRQLAATQQQQQAQKNFADQQAKVFEAQQMAAAEEANRQRDRLNNLNTLGATTIKSQDVRTAEGANLVLALASSEQDPAAIQARLQTKLLQQIALGIGQAASNYFNAPVAIVGGTSRL
jgi:hypothetical protein